LTTTERFIESEVASGRLKARRLTVKLVIFLPQDVQEWLDKKATTAKAHAQAKAVARAGQLTLEVIK
jgi:hypothetical protein